MYNETIKFIRENTKLITVAGVCYSSMFRVYGCVFCYISLLFAYMCMCMPSSLSCIAGVPSGSALSSLTITAHHVCAFLM